MKQITILLIFALLVCSSCSHRLRRLNTSQIAPVRKDLKGIQMILHEKIVLERDLGEGDVRVEAGKVISRNKRNINQIIIDKHELGEVLNDNNVTQLFVGFHDDASLGLWFIYDPSTDTYNPTYTTDPIETDAYGIPYKTVQFGKYKYRIVEGWTYWVQIPRQYVVDGYVYTNYYYRLRGGYLLFEKDYEKDKEIESEHAPGRIVN